MILVSKLSVPGEGDPEVPTNLGRRRGSAVNLHMLAGNFFIFFHFFLINKIRLYLLNFVFIFSGSISPSTSINSSTTNSWKPPAEPGKNKVEE